MGRKKNKRPRNKCVVSGTTDKNSDSKTEVSAEESMSGAGNILRTDEELSETKEKTNEDELLFVKYFPSGDRMRGREYYVHSLCQTCKKDLSERCSCERCGLVSYCSAEHRRLHWSEHAELCSAVQTVCSARGTSHILQSAPHTSPDAFRLLRMRNLQDCQEAVGRPLASWEQEMFIFPHVCGQCHEYKPALLVVCGQCSHSGFCQGHRPDSHDHCCAHILRYKRVIRDQKKFGVACPRVPDPQVLHTLQKLTSIDNAFKRIRSSLSECEFLELTEIVTYPLTVLNTLLTLNASGLLSSKTLVLHVVGAERSFETYKLEKWEYYLLHLIPQLQQLEVVFVGPELNVAANEKYKTCSRCLSSKKSIVFKFENLVYHELNKKTSISKPDLVCAFNPGLYRLTGFNGLDTWKPSIVSMFDKDCPVLATSYTEKEIFMDVDRVSSMQNVRLDKEPTLNPFSSLKPNLNFVSEEDSPVIFKNQFYCVMSKA